MWNALALMRPYLCLQMIAKNQACYSNTTRLEPKVLSCLYSKKFLIVSTLGSLFSRINKIKTSLNYLYSGYEFEDELDKLLSKQMNQELRSASSVPQTLGGMSVGDVTVLPSGSLNWEQRTLTRLYCPNGGYHLRILSDGTVDGGRQENDTYDILRLKAVRVGVVVIKGEMTGRYLAMDKNGHLYGSEALNDECYLLEKYEENNYNTYRSQKYSWYVALKKNGQPKRGPDTHQGQKAVCFLPRPTGSG